MKYPVQVSGVDMDGLVEGSLELVVCDVLPELRLTTFVVAADCIELSQSEQEAYFRVGERSIHEFSFLFSRWELQSGVKKSIEQQTRGSYYTVAYGQVTRKLEGASFELDCGLLIDVSLYEEEDSPLEGQWVVARGALTSFLIDGTCTPSS